jgi:transposase
VERKKYAAEFKSEAVKQVIYKGHAVVDVAKRLGIPEGFCTDGPISSKNQSKLSQLTLRRCKPRSYIDSTGGQ